MFPKEMTLQFFCPACGTLTIGNTTKAVMNDYYLKCGCGFSMGFYIETQRTKTDEEIEKAFQDTPLTDSQRGTKKRFSSSKRS